MLAHLRSTDEWAEKSLGAKGFTLIELLVVIIILGILAAVAIFAVGSINKNANKNACQTEVGTVETAVAAYEASTGNLPGSNSDVVGGANGNLKKAPKYVEVGANGVLSFTTEGTKAATDGCTL